MSIALMTQVWKTDLPSGRKMVLLALCDNANDQGECYPSIPMLATKCSMGERTVQQHIADMEASGIVAREMRSGRSTLYRINPRRICTPADFAPPQISHPTPAESALPPPQISHPTPADFAPITIKEPSIEPSRKHQKRAKQPRTVLGLADLVEMGVEQQVAQDWLAIRASKRLPLTKTALDGLMTEVDKARLTLPDVLRLCCERGWGGFSAAWVAVPGHHTPLPGDRRSVPRGGPGLSQKFNFADADRSGDRAAMEASMARHGIPPGDIAGDDHIPL